MDLCVVGKTKTQEHSHYATSTWMDLQIACGSLTMIVASVAAAPRNTWQPSVLSMATVGTLPSACTSTYMYHHNDNTQSGKFQKLNVADSLV